MIASFISLILGSLIIQGQTTSTNPSLIDHLPGEGRYDQIEGLLNSLSSLNGLTSIVKKLKSVSEKVLHDEDGEGNMEDVDDEDDHQTIIQDTIDGLKSLLQDL